jgi:hypothetical protein
MLTGNTFIGQEFFRVLAEVLVDRGRVPRVVTVATCGEDGEMHGWMFFPF